MLRIKTFVAYSELIPEAGLGLFTAQDIDEGETIWEFDALVDRLLTQREYNEISSKNILTSQFLDKYCYRENGKYILCVDNARFMNHSRELSNTIEQSFRTIAKRKILAGEEIFCNYEEFSNDASDKMFNVRIF
jgi:SET domain-containing protein